MALPENLKSGEIARLLPVASDTSKEARAASILLATMAAVKPFQDVLLESLGLKVGKRSTVISYTEVVFQKAQETGCRPDGLLVLESGRGKRWSALIEAKVGKADLQPEQIERYLGLAKKEGVDAVITLSNQFATVPTHSPIKVAKNSSKGVNLYHWSWVYVWTQAKLLLTEDVFSNDAERYILTEMVRYFGHPSIGVSRFDRMNSDWKDLVSKVQASAVIMKNDPALETSVSSWHQEVRDLALLMSRKLNTTVRAHLSRSHRDSPETRMKDDCEKLIKEQKLHARLDIPDAAAPLEVVADLVRRSICVYMTLSAPKDKKKTPARVNWLIKQLKNAKADNLYIRANWPGRAASTQAPLALLRDNVTNIEGDNKALVPSSFEIMLVHDMAGKFSGVKTFIEQLEEAVPWFYKNAGQHLRAYVAPPPKLRPKQTEATASNDPSIESPSLDPVSDDDYKEKDYSTGSMRSHPTDVPAYSPIDDTDPKSIDNP